MRVVASAQLRGRSSSGQTRAVMRALLIVGLLCLLPSLSVAQDTSKVSVFVGPQIRHGFADVDEGIIDSLKDIQDEVRASDVFSLARSRDGADMLVIVLGRGIITEGSAGFGSLSGGFGMLLTLPNQTPTISAVLKVGSYERTMQVQHGQWRGVAKQLVKDLTLWLDANRAALKP